MFVALESDASLPERFPRALLPEYAKWGQNLADDEIVEMQVSEKKPVYLTAVNRQKLEKLIETPHEDRVEISGEVFAADVKKGRFQLWSDEDTAVTVVFTHEQEDQLPVFVKDAQPGATYGYHKEQQNSQGQVGFPHGLRLLLT